MTALGDRLLLVLLAVTGLGGLVGYFLTLVVTDVGAWFTEYALPVIVGVFVLLFAFAVYEGIAVNE